MNIFDKPVWAIMPTVSLEAIRARYELGVRERAYRAESAEERYTEKLTGGRGLDENGTAYIVISGVIAEVSLWWAMWDDICVPSMVLATIRKFTEDANCKEIVFVFDSPGGCTDGIPALADAIRNCGKPTRAIVTGRCCSASYWLASQCETIVATRGAVIGCLGVYAVYWDTSKQAANMGITVRLFSTSELKGAGEWGTVITDKQAEMFTRFVNETGKIFEADIRRGRPSFDSAYFNGDFWHAEGALERGLIDDVIIA